MNQREQAAWELHLALNEAALILRLLKQLVER
jgi:hypothetical protein